MSKLVAQAPALAAKLLSGAKPRLETFIRYARVELVPPTPGDIPEIRSGIAKLINGAKSGRWKQTTVREGWLNSLITIEVLCWFYVGECIGKRHIVGYDV